MENSSLAAALFSLFDRQRFEENDHLSALIAETKQRWNNETELADDALLFVTAAGEAQLPYSGRHEDGSL